MSCTSCAQRREVIKQAMAGQTTLKQAATFIVKTMAEDAGRALVRSGYQKRR
jgi:hypothetical protein